MTHDLLRNVIHDLQGRHRRRSWSRDLKENTFYALIYLSVNGEAMAIDARPSDAIALALRARAPIFVEERVIDNAKTSTSRRTRGTPSGCRSGSRASTPTIWASTRCSRPSR